MAARTAPTAGVLSSALLPVAVPHLRVLLLFSAVLRCAGCAAHPWATLATSAGRGHHPPLLCRLQLLPATRMHAVQRQVGGDEGGWAQTVQHQRIVQPRILRSGRRRLPRQHHHHHRYYPRRVAILSTQAAGQLHGVYHLSASAAPPLLGRLRGVRSGAQQQQSSALPLLSFGHCALSLLPLAAAGVLRVVAATTDAVGVADVQHTTPTCCTTRPSLTPHTSHPLPSSSSLRAVKRLAHRYSPAFTAVRPCISR